MMRWISFLVTLPFTVAVALFSAFNLQSVTISTFPLPFDLTLPLAVLVLGSVVISFFMGAVVMWFYNHPVRAKARRDSKRVQLLEKELSTLRAASLKIESSSSSAAASSIPLLLSAR